MNWGKFFYMGGYGFYVWGAYSVAAIVLTLNVILPIWRHKVVLKRLRDRERLQKRNPA